MIIKKGFENIDINKVQSLYDKSFNDSRKFSDLYFSIYKKYYDLWTVWEKENLVMMVCLNKKKANIENKKYDIGIIVAVAVDEKYRGQGIMKKNLNKLIPEFQIIYKYVFIQAVIWNLYKSWNFNTCTKKYLSILKKDQFLRHPEILKINYDKCNKIYNQYVKLKKYKNFTYRTNKENKIIMKMMESAGDKIIQSNNCFLILSNNHVIDYAYTDLKDFIRLLSTLPYNTQIWGHEILDKRFFKYLNEEKEETKILDYKNFEILFSEFF